MSSFAQMLQRWNIKAEFGRAGYYPPTATFLTELGKLMFSYYMLKQYHPEVEVKLENTWRTWRFAVPAVMYGINNNGKLWVLAVTDAATTTVVERQNIIWCAILMYVILGRRFTIQQYVGIFMLLAGIVLTVYDPSGTYDGVSAYALMIFFIVGFSSAVASVYSEKLLKGSGDVMHFCNFQLYSFGLVVNAIGSVATIYWDVGAGSDFYIGKIFHGFSNPLLWLQIVVNASIGISISFVLRDFDSMVKNACAAAMILVVYIWALCTGDARNLFTFWLGAAIAMIGFLQYTSPPDLFASKPEFTCLNAISGPKQYSPLPTVSVDIDEDATEHTIHSPSTADDHS